MSTATLVDHGLAAFLRARCDEDEAAARAANTDEARRPWSDPAIEPVPEPEWGALIQGYLGGEVGDHCARWDPARVIAEVAAKRAILDRYDLALQTLRATPPGWTEGSCAAYRTAMRLTVRCLAQPYRERPDFDPAWKRKWDA
jgi:hypothetical protein